MNEYRPYYDANGGVLLILQGPRSIPRMPDNKDYAAFLRWLQEQGKTEDQWLQDNPPEQFVEQPTEYDVVNQQLQQKIRSVDLEHMNATQMRELLCLLLRRVALEK